MTGKQKCKILRELRREIAAANDLTYVTEECKFKGECRGTCPKCEAEVRDLERQLDLKAKAGRAFAAVGLSAAIAATATACDADDVRAFFRGSEEPDRSGDLVEETLILNGIIAPESIEPLVGKREFDPDDLEVGHERLAGVLAPADGVDGEPCEDCPPDETPDGAENGQN